MSEESIINDQQPVNSTDLELEDGELSEAELDAQSGGSFFTAKIQKQDDSSYTSVIGALGTDGNPAALKLEHMSSVNLPMLFP